MRYLALNRNRTDFELIGITHNIERGYRLVGVLWLQMKTAKKAVDRCRIEFKKCVSMKLRLKNK